MRSLPNTGSSTKGRRRGGWQGAARPCISTDLPVETQNPGQTDEVTTYGSLKEGTPSLPPTHELFWFQTSGLDDAHLRAAFQRFAVHRNDDLSLVLYVDSVTSF